MKKISWIVYGFTMALLHIGGVVVSVSTGSPVPLLALGTLMMIIYLTGLYGYVFRIEIRNRRTWQVVPWIMLAGLIMETFRSIHTEGFLIVVVPTLIAAPLLYALFRYGYWSTCIWETETVLDDRVA